jgi:hypothetical protein
MSHCDFWFSISPPCFAMRVGWLILCTLAFCVSAHACPLNYLNATSRLPAPVCNGRGVCNDDTQKCECDTGYGGLWCCPLEPYSNILCGSYGCCQSNGNCACTAEAVGTACEFAAGANGTVPVGQENLQTLVSTTAGITVVTAAAAVAGATVMSATGVAYLYLVPKGVGYFALL